jgi:DNA-binding NtrC family response regulator
MPNGNGAVVVISHDDENRAALRRIFREMGWTFCERRAVAAFRNSLKPLWSGVILTESSLPDGDWRDILSFSNSRCPGAQVVVMSRVADEALWAEVLNRGAFDLLAMPPEQPEVVRVGASAWRQSNLRASRASA